MTTEIVNTDAARGQLPAAQETQAATAAELAIAAMAAQQKAIVEARYKMALARPRDIDRFRQDLLRDARRPSFAAVAIYRKPVGKGIEGPSIRFVEAALRNMRNVLTETATLHDDTEKRVVRVAVTDLETNTYYSQDVTVSKTVERSRCPDGEKPIRIRTNSFGKPVFVLHATDDDILNKQNALVSKAVRTLGLRIVPGDIVDEALHVVRETLANRDAQDPDLARRLVLDSFAQMGVPADDLKEYVGHSLDTLSPAELQWLRGTFAALRDGETSWASVIGAKREQEAEKAQAKRKAPATKKTEARAQEQAEPPKAAEKPAAPEEGLFD